MSAPGRDDYVCWVPSDDAPPVKITAPNGQEAAKLYVLREQASGDRHDNDWSASHVLVVNYTTGDHFWFMVKVTVEAHQ